MDRGYGSGVWIGLWVQGMDRAVYFDLQLYIVDISWYLLLAIGMPWPALRLELDIETTIDIYLALATWSRGHMNFYVAKKRYCNQARRSSSARPPPKSFFLRFWVSLILIWNTISGRLHSLKLGYPQVHWIIIFPIQIAITGGISHQTHPYHATPCWAATIHGTWAFKSAQLSCARWSRDLYGREGLQLIGGKHLIVLQPSFGGFRNHPQYATISCGQLK